MTRNTGIITHNIDYLIDRPTVGADFEIGGHRNRATLGGDFSNLEFRTRRYFDTGTPVDPYNIVRGTFPGGFGSGTPL